MRARREDSLRSFRRTIGNSSDSSRNAGKHASGYPGRKRGGCASSRHRQLKTNERINKMKKKTHIQEPPASPLARASLRDHICWRSRLIQVSPVAKSRSTQTSLPNSRLSWSFRFSTSQSIRWHHLVAGQFEIGRLPRSRVSPEPVCLVSERKGKRWRDPLPRMAGTSGSIPPLRR